MGHSKHRPQRTCVACKSVKNKRALIRIIRTPDRLVVVDPTGKANGRGVYLCKDPACWEKGLKEEKLSQALKVPVLPEQIEALRAALQTELSKI